MIDPVQSQIGRHPRCAGVSRRTFLSDTGMGITGLALGAMLFRDGVARGEQANAHVATASAPSLEGPHFSPKA
jgi:hypothetical protein